MGLQQEAFCHWGTRDPLPYRGREGQEDQARHKLVQTPGCRSPQTQSILSLKCEQIWVQNIYLMHLKVSYLDFWTIVSYGGYFVTLHRWVGNAGNL